MTQYRLYFFGKDRHIAAAHDFGADSEETAIGVASALADACTSDCYRVEMWHGTECVYPRAPAAAPAPEKIAVSTQMQTLLLDTEERLQRSHWRIAESKRLAERVDRLRAELVREAG
ncbi:MAG: hypothetical protein ACREFZ_09860 [Acetobacteraceae bacterium]